MRTSKKTQWARELRIHQTLSEELLWSLIRNRQFLNLKFKRQVPIERFIVDFCCKEHMLIIEVDGKIHHDQKEHDQERESYLKERGYTIFRCTNDAINHDPASVLNELASSLQKHIFTAEPPSPARGRGLG